LRGASEPHITQAANQIFSRRRKWKRKESGKRGVTYFQRKIKVVSRSGHFQG